MQIINDLINQINAADRTLFTAISGVGTQVPMWALRKALVSQGNFYTVQQAISADPTNAVNIAWSNGAPSSIGDLLSASIQTALGYSGAQMITLYALAGTQTL
jgi:hypothetical protein